MAMYPVDQLRRKAHGVSGIGIGQHHEVAHERGDEQEGPCGQQIRRCLAVGARKSFGIEDANPPPNISATPVDDSMAARDESVEVAMNRLAWPIALRPSKVGGGPPGEGSRPQDPGWSQGGGLAFT